MKNKFANGRKARGTMRRASLILGSRMTTAAANMTPPGVSSLTLSPAEKGQSHFLSVFVPGLFFDTVSGA